MFKADRAVMDADEISAAAMRLFDYYCMRAGMDNPTCTASLERTASDLKKSYSWASRRRSELIEGGWILLYQGTVYILKGIEEYTKDAGRIVAEVAIKVAETANNGRQKLQKLQTIIAEPANKVAEVAIKVAETANAYKDEPAPLTSPFNQPIEPDSPPSSTTQVEAERLAPPAAPTSSKRRREKPKTTPIAALPESDRAVLEAWREVVHRYPRENLWPYVLERLRDDFDRERFMRTGSAYLAHFGTGQRHVAGICDWYVEDRTTPRTTGNGASATPAPLKKPPRPGAHAPPACATCNNRGFEVVCDPSKNFEEIEIACRYCERGRNWKPAKGSDECTATTQPAKASAVSIRAM